MKDELNMNEFSITKFIDYCEEKLLWQDLSNDVVMDVGCGEHVYVGNSILKRFPAVQKIIAIDSDQKLIDKLKLNATEKIEFVVADIVKRNTLKCYEGQMSKVLAIHVFHLITDIEEAFQNVYRLLKPGGEAVLKFVSDSFLYEWLMEMENWKRYAQQTYNMKDSYKDKLGSWYKERAETIGFKVVDYSEEKKVLIYKSDEFCKERLQRLTEMAFKIPLDLLKQFNEESFQKFVKINRRDSEDRPMYRSAELSLLLLKPADNPGSMI